MNNKTRFKNIIRGMRSVMDICPNTDYPQNRPRDPRRSDFEALRQDWNQVGKDISRAIDKAGHEKKAK
jgi:hypothetical protein